jgi:hypothetical protein
MMNKEDLKKDISKIIYLCTAENFNVDDTADKLADFFLEKVNNSSVGDNDSSSDDIFEYEMFFKSEPDDFCKIDGWYPISTSRIKNQEKIEEYISTGILRKIDTSLLAMVFGDNENTIYKKFDTSEYPEYIDFLNQNDGKVNLTYIGFAEEWSGYVNFDESYAYINGGKLHVIVYGLPNHINKKTVEDYFGKMLEHYIKQGYGEFFETEPGCPICMVVERNGKDIIV